MKLIERIKTLNCQRLDALAQDVIEYISNRETVGVVGNSLRKPQYASVHAILLTSSMKELTTAIANREKELRKLNRRRRKPW